VALACDNDPDMTPRRTTPKSPREGEPPIRSFATKRTWAQWLDRNHNTASGVWLRLARKTAGLQSVTQDEALDIALAYGWIDAKGQSESETHWLLKFTPRLKRSLWSKRNREKALALIAAGDMKPSGLAEVERARQDGRWAAAYDSPSRIAVPEDLQAALNRNARAKRFFGSLDGRNRYAVLFRIHTARKPDTREKRIRQFIAMMARGEKVHP
jgi:uncharacterized protein YdeI (YjbR/CyaY-like superfamily)